MIEENMYEFGWILIYVSVFGYSDYLVKKYCKSINMYLFYYFITGVIGIFIIRTHTKNHLIQNRHRNTSTAILI